MTLEYEPREIDRALRLPQLVPSAEQRREATHDRIWPQDVNRLVEHNEKPDSSVQAEKFLCTAQLLFGASRRVLDRSCCAGVDSLVYLVAVREVRKYLAQFNLSIEDWEVISVPMSGQLEFGLRGRIGFNRLELDDDFPIFEQIVCTSMPVELPIGQGRIPKAWARTLGIETRGRMTYEKA